MDYLKNLTIAIGLSVLRWLVGVRNERYLKLSPGRLIFASEANGDFILLAAWWPWANGTIISMRIGLYSTGKTPLCRDEAARCLREWLEASCGLPPFFAGFFPSF